VRRRIYPFELAREQALPFTVASVTGSPVSGVTSDHTAYPAAVHGYFNWRNVAIARAVCRPGDTIFDVGANIGTETVCFSDIVGSAGAVCSFEPFPPNVDQLRRNVDGADNRNITILPLALGDADGELRFAIPPPDNSGVGHVVAAGGGPADAEEVIVVRSTTLDALHSGLPRPSFVTIDVEGYEEAILRGAGRLLSETRPVIVIEVLSHLLRRAGSSPEAIAAALRQHDYRLHELTRFGLAPISAPMPEESDWIAIPAEAEAALIAPVRRTLRRAALLPVLIPLSPLSRAR
jgi:FkbM family methyltransferase